MWSQALLLLIVVALSGSAAVIALIGAGRGNRRLFLRAGVASLVIGAAYGALIIGVALTAPEKYLKTGEEKYICELDCHLAYSIASVHRRGDSLMVRLNVRFAEESISSRRAVGAPLYPGARTVSLRGGDGTRYRPISLGDLSRTLRPGESYQTDLVFAVPRGASGLVLYVTDADPTKMLLVGSDNAPFRLPVGFQL